MGCLMRCEVYCRPSVFSSKAAFLSIQLCAELLQVSYGVTPQLSSRAIYELQATYAWSQRSAWSLSSRINKENPMLYLYLEKCPFYLQAVR